MKRAFPILCLLLAAGIARAQQQEPGMLERIDLNTKRAMQAMDANAKSDPSLASPLASKSYKAGAFEAKTFSVGAFSGTKSASAGTFETRSFLGIKNPWFGKKVFATDANREAQKAARESQQTYRTQAFAVRKYEQAGKADLRDATAELPSAAEPRPYLVPGKTQGAMDRYTENLHKDLSIDDVRDLLNKGKGE
jgi:hypothetical protein